MLVQVTQLRSRSPPHRLTALAQEPALSRFGTKITKSGAPMTKTVAMEALMSQEICTPSILGLQWQLMDLVISLLTKKIAELIVSGWLQ